MYFILSFLKIESGIFDFADDIAFYLINSRLDSCQSRNPFDKVFLATGSFRSIKTILFKCFKAKNKVHRAFLSLLFIFSHIQNIC